MIRAESIKAKKKPAGESEAPVPLPDFQALFEAVPDPCLVLDRELRIIAVNNAYLSATMTVRDDILGRGIFDVFPDNPDEPTSTGADNLSASLKRVLANGTPENMAVQRYDVRMGSEGGFEERYWNAINTPVFGPRGQVLYVIHRVQDITGFVHLQQQRTEEQKVSEEYRAKSEAELFMRSREIAATNRELRLAVDALHESQQLFHSFMAQLPAAAWIKDLQGRYVFANAAMERLFNRPAAEMMGKTVEEVYPAEIAEQFRDSDRRVLEEGPANFQVVREAGGGERFLMVSKFPIPGADGRPEFIAGLAFDVTEAKEMEAEIQRLASYPLLNPNPVLEMNTDGRVSFCNPAAREVLEKVGLCDDRVNPFVPADLPQIVGDLLDHKIMHAFREVEINGRIFEELLTLAPQSNTLRCYTMDITRRKLAEAEREELLLKLEAVLDNINEGVVISDLDGNVLAMNREALALHGYRSVEDVRRHMSEFQERFELADLEGRPIPLEQWPLTKALRGERFTDYEARVLRKDTDGMWVGTYSGTPVLSREDRAILAVITIRDITRRKEMEAQIAKLNADLAARVSELEAFNQELEAFNRMVSHDLRQPLNTIATSCQAIEMLCGDRLGADCKGYVRIAYEKVLAMNGLIGALLTFSRSTHGELKRETINLSEIAKGVAAEVRLTDPSRRVTFKIADNAMANGDANLLRSVLDNLIGNAWKYTGNREEAIIEFGVSEVGSMETFFVRDNGSGFDMADSSVLFTPFKRLPGAERFRGFGIGLATVERIVRRHGGRVWAEGAPDKGATFYFTLPADAAS